MKMQFAGIVILSSAIAVFCPCLGGQEKADPSLLTLERIFDSREFAPARFGPARWMKDGQSYTTVEDSAAVKDEKDIVLYAA